MKKRARDICKGTLDVEFKRDWSVGLGATIGDGRKLKTIFLVSGIFLRKADSVILLGFECTINVQNLIKIVGAIFEKIKTFNFFLMWTTLNFRGREKTKTAARDIYKRTLDIKFERDRSIGLGHGCAKVAHCVTTRWRNFSHYLCTVRLNDVFWAQRSTDRRADGRRCTQRSV